MIRSFRSKSLRKFAAEGDTSKLSVQNPARIRRILLALDKTRIPDAMNLPGLRFHSLRGEDTGRHTVDGVALWQTAWQRSGSLDRFAAGLRSPCRRKATRKSACEDSDDHGGLANTVCFVACALRSGVSASAGRLAATGDADLFLQIVDADRADHDLLADHIARGAVHAPGFRELEVLLQHAGHFGARHLLLYLAPFVA